MEKSAAAEIDRFRTSFGIAAWQRTPDSRRLSRGKRSTHTDPWVCAIRCACGVCTFTGDTVFVARQINILCHTRMYHFISLLSSTGMSSYSTSSNITPAAGRRCSRRRPCWNQGWAGTEIQSISGINIGNTTSNLTGYKNIANHRNREPTLVTIVWNPHRETTTHRCQSCQDQMLGSFVYGHISKHNAQIGSITHNPQGAEPKHVSHFQGVNFPPKEGSSELH